MFADPLRELGRPRPAGDELPRARRDDGQPRGPRAAPAPHGDPARARRDRVDREARRALRRLDRPARARTTPTGAPAATAVAERPSSTAPRHRQAPPRRTAARSSSSATARSSPGPVVERVEELQFQRPDAEIELSARDAEVRGIATGDDGRRPLERHRRCSMRARVNRRLVDGAVRAPEEHVRELDQARGGEQAVNIEPRDRPDKALVERVEELQFQRPDSEIELSAHDADVRNIANGETWSSARTAPPCTCARGSTGSSSTAQCVRPKSTSARSTRQWR